MHLPSKRGRGRRAPMADINVTPLVDVMLVLLIIFMVTAPLLTAGVPVNLPESKAKAVDQEEKPAQVAIDERGLIYVDNQQVSEAELPAALAAVARRTGPDGKPPQVFFRADQGLGYGKAMMVLGEINNAGLKRVALLTNSNGK
jgi:biopolymer transport protein TolR